MKLENLEILLSEEYTGIDFIIDIYYDTIDYDISTNKDLTIKVKRTQVIRDMNFKQFIGENSIYNIIFSDIFTFIIDKNYVGLAMKLGATDFKFKKVIKEKSLEYLQCDYISGIKLENDDVLKYIDKNINITEKYFEDNPNTEFTLHITDL